MRTVTVADSAVVAVDRARLAYSGGPVVLSIDHLRFPATGLVCLVGPNGSGKSTLLAALTGGLAPLVGRITVRGTSPRRARPEVAMVFQSTPSTDALPLTVAEVVTMARFAGRGLLRRLTARDRAAVVAALEALGIEDLAARQLDELSGGQRQRVLVAQGVAQEAAVLLLDEPLTGVDRASRARILQLLDGLRARTLVVLSTHDLDDAARADQVVLLAGRVVASGPPAQALTRAHLSTAYGGLLLDQHPPRAPGC